MLSLSNVGNDAAAASYYENADDYYTSDRGPSAWWGAGAASLGLHGAVDPGQFAALLEGRLPSGETLHNAAAGRRGGTDGTFSAPKSVSLQLLVGGDRRIIDAHCAAVERALAHAETLVACRVTDDGTTRSERTGNMVVARFTHDLSRACDPQLHTHCVMINATRRADGQWRAIDNQAIYGHKMLLGALYRAELARELQALGYAVRVTHEDGRFELAHINENQVRVFSQRSTAIETYLKKHQGLERSEAGAWDKKLVAVITREKKTDIDRAYLRKQWESLSAAQGIDYNPTPPTLGVLARPDAAAVLTQAIAHVSERKSVFSRQGIVQAALECGVGVTTLIDIDRAREEAIACGQLIREGERYTTPQAQQWEREILDMETHGRSTLRPIYQGERSALVAQLKGLSNGQRDAALGILLSTNQIIGIQGRAGVGKTTLLKLAAAQAKACGYAVKGLAPTASAARELGGAGINAQTISAFDNLQSKALHAKTLLLVDEAGMTSTRQLHRILSEATAAGCRVVLIGDTAQLQSVEAGKPFAQLQAHGMHTAAVNQILRQKNQVLKHAVELAVDGQTALAVQILDKHVTEIVHAATRFEKIASDYVSLSEAERATTRVIAGTRYARGEINRCIRSQLGLADQGQEFVMLDRKDMTAQQACSILSYEAEDLLMAEKDYTSLGLKRGETALVVERLNHCIMLQRTDGARIAWQPALATKLTAYVPVKRSLAVGDLVRVTANDRMRGLINGDMARVSAIAPEGKTLTVSFEDGRTVLLDGRRPLTLNYGYCSTVHASQGQTCDRVLIEANSYSLTANVNTFYVAISRARHEAHIYTDDREMLPVAMSREIENLAALDVHDQSLSAPR